jgi:serine/alanine adding enzyme
MRIVRQIDPAEWGRFVENHPNGNIFQSPEMFQVYSETENYEPVFLGAVDARGTVMGTLLAVVQREFTRPFGALTARSVIWGGPLVKDDDPGILGEMLNEYEKVTKKRALYSQFRNLWDVRAMLRVFGDHGYDFEEHLNIFVDLTKTEDQLWSEVHQKRRNEIRRAARGGVRVKELEEKNDIHQLYAILSEVYEHARLPFAHKSMFMSAWDILRKNNMLKYFGAVWEGQLIGVICILCYRDTIIDWYAGSLRSHLSKYPNDLLPWEVFKWGKTQGYSKFDFGGAGRPGQEYGVRDYKKKFGGYFVNFGRFEKIHRPFLYRAVKTAFDLWRKRKP